MGLGEGGRKRATVLWYLVGSPSHKNLREVLERLLGRVHETLTQRQLASGLPVRARRRRQRSNTEQTASQMARLRREARYEDVVALYTQGVPVLRIAEDLHMSRTTVRKFVAAGAFPERATPLRRKSILDPSIPYLKQRLEQGPANASQLWRDVREQGFSGSYKVIARWVQAQGWQLQKGRFSHARRMQEPFMQMATGGTTLPQEYEQPEQARARPQATLEVPLESP